MEARSATVVSGLTTAKRRTVSSSCTVGTLVPGAAGNGLNYLWAGLQLPGPDDSLVSQPPGGQTSSGGFSFKSLFGLRGRKPKA